MGNFILHERLAADSLFITDLSLSECRLMNSREFPWLILIPKRPALLEWIDLRKEDQILLLEEINLVSRVLKHSVPCEKLNLASFGNVVSQLHIHLIARTSKDSAWPRPVFGEVCTPYSKEEAEARIQEFKNLLIDY